MSEVIANTARVALFVVALFVGAILLGLATLAEGGR